METRNINKNLKKIVPLLILFAIIIIPVLTFAQAQEKPIIPCGGPGQHECGYYDLLRLVNNIIDWIIMISVPVAAGVLAWAGFKYMTTGISDQKSEAKEIIKKVLIGLFFILAAWIIVSTVLNALLAPEFKTAVDKTVDISP